MAFDPAPSTHITGWSENGTDVTFPIASVPELDATEADGTTGDIRKVMYALCAKMHALMEAMATADKPTKVTSAKSSSIKGDTITRQFNFTFTCDPGGIEVAAES